MADPYKVLGVQRDADQDTIKKAYKNLARKYHPDRNDSPTASTKFKEVNAANDVVGDPKKRKMYDDFGEASTRPGFDPDQARAFRGGGFPGGGAFTGGSNVDFEDLLGSMFGAGGGPRPVRGRDRQVDLTIPFMKSVLGSEEQIRLPQPDGRLETFSIRIPAGVRTGGRLTMKGQGHPPPGGGPCGDLKIKLEVAEHPCLRRIAGNDLEMDVPITVLEAIKGSRITVPTPTGSVKVSVPAGCAQGTRLRLRAKGIQVTTPGDLYLVLRPTVPVSEDEGVIMAAQRIEEAYVGNLRGKLVL
jgi:curved DNA-binding protein